jgi:hypothetical protein
MSAAGVAVIFLVIVLLVLVDVLAAALASVGRLTDELDHIAPNEYEG